MRKIEKIGNTIIDYNDCDNWDTECPSDCNLKGYCFRPKTYEI